jgi:hypothetical protein
MVSSVFRQRPGIGHPPLSLSARAPFFVSGQRCSSGARLLEGVAAKGHPASDDLGPRPEPLLNIGITWRGLAALLPAERLAGAETDFPADFRDPPPESMAGAWKGRFAGDDVHVVVCLHCRSETGLSDASRQLRQEAASGFAELQPNTGDDPAITARSLGGRRLHFGFLDGISEPAVNWEDAADRPGLLDMRQFLLGYWSKDKQSFPREGRWADFVRDGTYCAFQWIRRMLPGLSNI